jgi:hypothetical protein
LLSLSRFSASTSLVIAAGLATSVELAVAVGAVLPKLAKLVTLAGLVSILSPNCTEVGIVMAFATVDIPSLIEVVAVGASCGLLIPAPPPAMSDDKALCPGFSLIAVACLWFSSLLRLSSAIAAAPVSGIDTKPGENTPLNRGDFGDGEALNSEFGVKFRFDGDCDWSGRLRFKDFVRVESGKAAWLSIGFDVVVAGADSKFVVKAGADTPPGPPCSDAMSIGR